MPLSMEALNDISKADSARFARAGASLTFKDLGFAVPLSSGETKSILEPCSGHFEPGELVALMGPSGCGKSTLLDMLAMKKTSVYSGEVLVNGHTRDARSFPRIAVYVGQEDVMPEYWTVREAVKFNAALKTRRPKTKIEGEAPVDLLLAAFGLASVADTYIGGSSVRGISGGQRRRVTLARGVAAQASLMFCDEPTSGLSATDAELCVKALRTIAKALNVLIVVVIHQPRVEVAQMFDQLVLLTANPGRMCYMGPMAQAVSYIESCGRPVPEHVNPTDYFLDIVTPGLRLDASDHFAAMFKQHLEPQILSKVEWGLETKGLTIEEMLLAQPGARLGHYAVPFHKQFQQLLRRKLAITLRNPLALVGIGLMLPVVFGTFVGAMFTGFGHQPLLKQMGFVFILITVLGLGGMQLMPILIEERRFLKHETSEALYAEGPSVLASFCVDVPLASMGAALEILIMFYFAGFDWEHLGCVFFWCMLVFFVYDSLFGFVAAVAADGQQAQALATPVLAIFLLCNGFIVSKASAPAFLQWIFAISPNGYAMQAITLNLAEGGGAAGRFVLARAGYVAGENGKGVAALVSMIVVLRLLQLVALKLLHKVQK
mmetsp:Transcript_31801/g.84686  ORF Transcript_31801/g.84686 Transcript_31801/m.84686 type:complete len:603 (+) Transcript_31801:2-1810(+)